MAVLSSPGVGSGLDIAGLVSKLMAVEQQPVTLLNKKEASFQAKLSAYSTLKGSLATLQSAAQTLASTATFTGISAAVSDATVYSASATSEAAVGSYDITVSKLAKANQIHTNVDYGTDIFDSGTLRITIGAGTATETTTDIVTTSNNTLTGIRDAINGGNAGVTATIVNDGTADRLVLTSATTGSAGAITLAAPATGNDGTRRLTDLIGANLTTDQPAQNAEFTVNNLAISRSSNIVTDAISGVTLNLLKADATTPVAAKLTLSKNTSTIPAALKTFVDAYNTAIGQIKSFTAYDAANKKASALTGDSTARGIQSQLIGAIGGTVTGVSGGIGTLSDIGVTVQKDGTLALNTAKLTTVLSDSSMDVATLFTSTDTSNPGIGVRFNTALESLIGTSGLIPSRSEGITSSIKTISDRREALNVRLAAVEARYRRQFNALDSVVASMQSTQTYLTQQLEQISSITSQSN